MPRQITQYRIFIGSPGGLRDEREAFRRVLTTFNEHHGEPNGIVFAPVGWEDTLGGVGRPQELINEDLRQCDFAVFVFHDRWGSPTGNGTKVGTEEEWELVQDLYEKKTIRKICLLFKHVDQSKLADPGPQLQQVLNFKGEIEKGKKHLFLTYGDVTSYCTALEKHVASWMREIAGTAGKELAVLSQPLADEKPAPASEIGPSFSFWLEQSRQLSSPYAPTTDMAGARFCAEMASKLARTDAEWADAENARAVVLEDPAKSFDSFSAAADRFVTSRDPVLQRKGARALINKGVILGQLGRSDEQIAVYDDLVSRFGAASEIELCELVARALVNKGLTLSQHNRSDEAIAAYDDVIGRFETENETVLREQIAVALVSKGVVLSRNGRGNEAISVYDDVVGRFGTESEPIFREQVASALVNKGIALDELRRGDEAIVVYDDVVGRFGAASDPALRERVASALVNKGVTLGELGHDKAAVAVCDDVIIRFGTASETALREAVARALFNKGFRLDKLGRSEEAIAAYDDIVGKFGTASETALREQVANALVNKGIALGGLGRADEAIAICDDVAGRFGTASEIALRTQVVRALLAKVAALVLLGRRDEAIAISDDVTRRFGTEDEAELRSLFDATAKLRSLLNSEPRKSKRRKKK
ncbi:MAG: hypothetical protein QOJ86_1715 [Bradyrhizobium sp.]|jgi:tetratricopeptide (TPR) repeat protein|nr:hypothetical protein [Bradyrhizobium sp.]